MRATPRLRWLKRRWRSAGIGDAFRGGHVGASGERAAGAGDNQDARIAIVAHALDQAFKLDHDLAVHAIEPLGPVEGDRRDRAVFSECEAFEHETKT